MAASLVSLEADSLRLLRTLANREKGRALDDRQATRCCRAGTGWPSS